MSRNSYRKRSTRREAGFSMIELLVAVLVMGIGVLGITALQMVSLQNNRGALMRSEATLRTYDVMDRIRAAQLSVVSCKPLLGGDTRPRTSLRKVASDSAI